MESINTTKKKNLYINSMAESAVEQFGETLYHHLLEIKKENSDIAVLCIGTDRATGDSLGPLVGYKLSNSNQINAQFHLFGTLDNPVHANNLVSTIKKIYNTCNNPTIIAIDASLGQMGNIGYLTIGKGSLSPGAGVSKKLPKVGDVAITGIVNFSGVMELVILQNTRLHIVMKMADVIASGILNALDKLSFKAIRAQ